MRALIMMLSPVGGADAAWRAFGLALADAMSAAPFVDASAHSKVTLRFGPRLFMEAAAEVSYAAIVFWPLAPSSSIDEPLLLDAIFSIDAMGSDAILLEPSEGDDAAADDSIGAA